MMMPIEGIPAAADQIRKRVKQQDMPPADVELVLAAIGLLEVGLFSMARSAEALERIADVLERQEKADRRG